MSKVIVHLLRSPVGGIRKHVYDIIESLENENVEQIFITNIEDSDRPIPIIKNLEVFNFPISDQPEVHDVINIFKMYMILRSKSVDIIHGHGAKGGIYARILGFLLGGRVIYTPHGGSLHRVFGPFKNFLYDSIEKFFYFFTDIYLFESHYSADEFAKNVMRAGTKSIVNYNGVDIYPLSPEKSYQKGEKLNLASFGLLRHLKGHDIVINACKLLKQDGIPFNYTIYGSGEELDSLKLLVNQLLLDGDIVITPLVGDVIQEMKKYDFIVQPSRFESFGYVPVEAMSAGVPVISSNEGGLKEVVDIECGYISINNTPVEYFQILKSIFEGDRSFENKIINGYHKVESNFSKIRMLKKIHEIYRL